MLNKNDIRSIILPLVKGLPIILTTLGLAVFIAIRTINYSVPMYEATAKIKLDDQQFGVSHNNLFKDFDMFSSVNKIDAEVEILKSQLLLSKASQHMHDDVRYYRHGNIKTSEMYKASPFKVTYAIKDSACYQTTFYLNIEDTGHFVLSYTYGNKTTSIPGTFNVPIKTPLAELMIGLTNATVSSGEVKLVDQFSFVVLSKEQQLKSVNEKQLDVKALDKDIPIIRLSYRSEVPEKSADFVNALAKAYINDYVSSKAAAAEKTVVFIDKRLEQIAMELDRSEKDLQHFKLENHVVNTYQETETGLKKLSELRIQQTNLEMNETALDELHDYITRNQHFDHAAPHVGFGDLLFTESIKNLRLFTNEKRDLLTRYTADNEKIKNIDAKINDLKKYIIEAIKNSKKDINIKKRELDAAVELASHEFDGLPIRERNQVILERKFRLNEKMYNFLSEKKMEAMVAQNANLCFHRIIQYADTPLKPVSPNKTLIVFVAGFLGLFVGIGMVFLIHTGRGRIESRFEIEKHSSLPLAGIIKRSVQPIDTALIFNNLVKNLQLLNKLSAGNVITVTSSIHQEGKTHTAQHLANAASQIGFKTLYIKADTLSENTAQHQTGLIELLAQPTLVHTFIAQQTQHLAHLGLGNYHHTQAHLLNINAISLLIDELKTAFQLIIIEAPSSTLTVDAITWMKLADTTLYLTRHNSSNFKYLANAEYIAHEYQINNINLVLNDYSGSSNFNGLFSGALFTNLTFWQRIKNRMEIPVAFLSNLKKVS
ncbi:MAG: hypothetical protein EAY81_01720 [Bacteroidetes bacterium]|nr:MAG: hypothetical protein EAY81_01720 [Bacteroidota bacterium]